MRRLLETTICLVVALIGVGTWLISPFAVVSGSMTPTLLGPHRNFVCEQCGRSNRQAIEQAPVGDMLLRCTNCNSPGPPAERLPLVPGDRILVDRTAFLRSTPQRWDVAALRLPHDPSKIAVKRIVGLPGETIALSDGELLIDGRTVAKPDQLRHIAYEPPRIAAPPSQWKLASDEYFVLGDFPAVSDDSRSWPAGPGVAAQLLIGKPVIVHFPYRTTYWYGRPFHVPDLASIRYIR